MGKAQVVFCGVTVPNRYWPGKIVFIRTFVEIQLFPPNSHLARLAACLAES